MAVNYTKVFTVIGKYIDKVNDYYAYISTFTTDQAAIETVLSAQSVIYLEGDLPSVYAGFKSNVSTWAYSLIGEVSSVLTDDALIGVNFALGSATTIQNVMPVFVHDMIINSKSVLLSTISTGTNHLSTNTNVGNVILGTKLDGVTSPMAGAPAVRDYAGWTSQLAPDSESLTLTCVTDSENGAIRGSESFVITGTLASSDAFSAGGENVGTLGSINSIDNSGSQYVTNGGFDVFDSTTSEFTAWTDNSSDPTAKPEQDSTTIYSTSTSSLVTSSSCGGETMTITQTLNPTIYIRDKAYFLAVWAQKVTDAAGDQDVEVIVSHDRGVLADLVVNPSTTNWTLFSTQFIVPSEIIGDLIVEVTGTIDTGSNDQLRLDNLVIVPCEYFSGVAIGVVSGPDKFLIGDQFTVTLSNNNAGKFQTFFRKAYKVQLPTNASPTISDSLVA